MLLLFAIMQEYWDYFIYVLRYGFKDNDIDNDSIQPIQETA